MVLNWGWTGWRNCEIIFLFLLHYFHTLIYFGQIFTEFDQFDKNCWLWAPAEQKWSILCQSFFLLYLLM